MIKILTVEQRPECIGEICWLEIPVMDIVRAQKFYTDIFGWNCNSQVVRPSDGNVPAGEDCPVKSIHFFNKGQTLNGAFQLMRDDNHFANVDLDRPHAIPVLPTLNVKDCAKTLEQVEQAGGRTQWYMFLRIKRRFNPCLIWCG